MENSRRRNTIKICSPNWEGQNFGFLRLLRGDYRHLPIRFLLTIKLTEMKNKLLVIMILISGAFLYPFSCEGQTNLPCDPVYVEDPIQEAKIVKLQKDLSAELDKNDALVLQMTTLSGELEVVKADLSNLQIIANTQGELITVLEKDLADCQAKPPATVTDTIYKEADYITVAGKQYKVSDIELIKPFKEIDTVVVSHCDSTKYTKWFHHGGISGYPHYISFSTKEYSMVKVLFTDSLTNEIKVQQQYTLKRIKDYSKAETVYEFIN